MTVEEAKLKYGNPSRDYYVYCADCPLFDPNLAVCSDRDVAFYCDGCSTTWEAIAKVMTERENNKPTEIDDTDCKCDTCIHELYNGEHPTCWDCGKHGVDNYEEKSCYNCKYFDKYEDEEPCKDCRNKFHESKDEYKTTPFLWESPYSVPETVKPSETDNVIHPSHYNQGGIECWDAMEAAYGKEAVKHFCICNAFKYVWRTDHKNGMEDINKAINYLNKYKELCSGGDVI